MVFASPAPVKQWIVSSDSGLGWTTVSSAESPPRGGVEVTRGERSLAALVTGVFECLGR
jgi:hypothetical protein